LASSFWVSVWVASLNTVANVRCDDSSRCVNTGAEPSWADGDVE
jgi:hypothetical protein